MHTINKTEEKYIQLVNRLRGAEFLPLLFIRLILSYGFFLTAGLKWKDMHAIGKWFEFFGIPAPYFSAYLAGCTEAAGVVLLLLGLGTRLISIPLMFVLTVAIITVNGPNGFSAGKNGIEIPLYYFLMLFTLVVFGPGKISLDELIRTKEKKSALRISGQLVNDTK